MASSVPNKSKDHPVARTCMYAEFKLGPLRRNESNGLLLRNRSDSYFVFFLDSFSVNAPFCAALHAPFGSQFKRWIKDYSNSGGTLILDSHCVPSESFMILTSSLLLFEMGLGNEKYLGM